MSIRSDFAPTASIKTLQLRAAVLRQLRSFFDHAGFWEVQTPLLSVDTCVDPWIDPFRLPGIGPCRRDCYLQTSPEFCMKRMLAAGADRIYEVTRSFRRGEWGERHNPEFTIVEWYRVGDDHQAQMEFTEQLVRAVCRTPGLEAPPLSETPFLRLSYDDAFLGALGERVLEQPTQRLIELARRSGASIPSSLSEEDRDGWLNLLLAERVEPYLETLGPVFLYDFPASQAALARIRKDAAPVAERFELYISGFELCNGYHELTDPAELLGRMQHHSEIRVAAGKDALPADSRLIQAMQHGLPDCAGVALGFDRLMMWLVGTQRISELIAFPFDRA
jgi:lysyl-tRNA synthetase class 2